MLGDVGATLKGGAAREMLKGDTPPYFYPKDFDGSGAMHGGKLKGTWKAN